MKVNYARGLRFYSPRSSKDPQRALVTPPASHFGSVPSYSPLVSWLLASRLTISRFN